MVDTRLLKVPSTIGKKSFSADRIGVGFSTNFSLTMKTKLDVSHEGVLGKKGKSKSGLLPR